MQGGLLSIHDLRGLLSKAYKDSNDNFEDYEIDKSLSGKRAKVYKKKGSEEAVVVHRGTKGFQDLVTDAKLLFGADVRKTKRYKHAQRIQDEAERKYGAENVSTLGHSLGADIASKVGKKSKEIINLNKGVGFGKSSPINANETNIRTAYDPVSALLPLTGYNNDKLLTIPSTSFNLLAEHKVDTLDRLPGDKMVGEENKKRKFTP